MSATGAGCVSEPVSWLRLERYALGELTGDAARSVADHLATCAACRACLDQIEGDAIALPPLPARASMPAQPSWWATWWSRLFVGGGLVAAAAAVALFVVIDRGGGGGGERHEPAASPTVAIKGASGDVVVELAVIRERARAVEIEAASVDAGDRLKLRVTCPPAGGAMHADVVVFQPGTRGALEAAFPLPARTIACANEVTLDGAFRVTPSSTGVLDATVCVALDPRGAIDREALARRGPRGPGVACVPLSGP